MGDFGCCSGAGLGGLGGLSGLAATDNEKHRGQSVLAMFLVVAAVAVPVPISESNPVPHSAQLLRLLGEAVLRAASLTAPVWSSERHHRAATLDTPMSSKEGWGVIIAGFSKSAPARFGCKQLGAYNNTGVGV